TVFDGTIAMEQSGYFVTSYPYAKGYTAVVDGVKQKIEKVNTCFIGFPLEAGQHKIEITFKAPGYKIAMAISIVSLILLIFLVLRERKKIK
ncbi:MAG: YfhO family protein, partial [Anaerovoracaceae bacterium]